MSLYALMLTGRRLGLGKITRRYGTSGVPSANEAEGERT